jgi:hypothetical protein
MADLLAQMWLWMADAFEDRPAYAIGTALVFVALLAGVVVVMGA